MPCSCPGVRVWLLCNICYLRKGSGDKPPGSNEVPHNLTQPECDGRRRCKQGLRKQSSYKQPTGALQRVQEPVTSSVEWTMRSVVP